MGSQARHADLRLIGITWAGAGFWLLVSICTEIVSGVALKRMISKRLCGRERAGSGNVFMAIDSQSPNFD